MLIITAPVSSGQQLGLRQLAGTLRPAMSRLDIMEIIWECGYLISISSRITLTGLM